MARDKRVMFTLIGLGEAGQAVELPEGGKQLLPPGQGLVDVALVPHIEHQPVRGSVKYPVDSHCQLHRSQVCGQMAAGPGNVFYQE